MLAFTLRSLVDSEYLFIHSARQRSKLAFFLQLSEKRLSKDFPFPTGLIVLDIFVEKQLTINVGTYLWTLDLGHLPARVALGQFHPASVMTALRPASEVGNSSPFCVSFLASAFQFL